MRIYIYISRQWPGWKKGDTKIEDSWKLINYERKEQICKTSGGADSERGKMDGCY